MKVVDFGIAKAVAATGVSHSGSLKGKVGYMSPEQAHGVELDGRSDVFAVGVMLHEMITGERLFLARLLTQPIPSPREIRGDVPRDLARVTMRMLSRDRDERFPTAHAALDALLECDCVTARAQLELRSLVRARFPDQVPRRSSEAPAQATPTSRKRPAAAVPIAFDKTYSAGTPTPAGQRAATSSAPPVRSRLGLWIALAAMLSITAMITTLVVLGSSGDAGGQDAGNAVASSAHIDAFDAATSIESLVGVAPLDAGVRVDATAVVVADDKTDRRKDGRRSDRDKRKPPGETRPKTTTDPPPDPKEPVATKPVRDDAMGTIKVVVRPWAVVSVGSKSYGKTPVTLTLPAGKHNVRLSNPDLGKSETVPVTVVADEQAKLSRDWN